MTDFLFGHMFFIDLLAAGLIVMAALPKKNRPAARILVVLAACLLIGTGWSRLFGLFDSETLPVMILNYLGVYLIVLGGLKFVFSLRGWAFLYAGTFIWLVQQAANCIDFGILPSSGMSMAAFLRHEALVVVIALLVFRFCTGKFQTAVLERLKLDRVAPIWLMMYVVCCGLNSYANLTAMGVTAFYLAELCFDVLAILYLKGLYVTSGLEREEEAIRLLMEQSRRQYEISRENIEQINIKSHDLRHQIRAFRQSGQIGEEVLEGIEKTINSYDAVVHTGNEALDTILTEKSLACQAKNIGFTCMAEGKSLCYMEASDLYALFGNALENAIEAAEKLTDPSRKQISFTLRRIGGFYIAQLQNYTEEKLDLSSGLPKTTKEDRNNHGFGVRSMQLLADKYGGQISYTQDEDVVELDLMLPASAKKEE